jgi:hypothetical protein
MRFFYLNRIFFSEAACNTSLFYNENTIVIAVRPLPRQLGLN